MKELFDVPDPFASAVAPAPPDVAKLPASASRAHARRVRTIAALGALAYEAAWLVVVGWRSDLGAAPAWALALGIVAPLAASAIALVAVTSRGARGLGPTAERLTLFVGAPLVLFAVAALAVARGSVPMGATFWAGTAMCMAMTTMLAMGPLVFGAIAMRRAFASASRWRTAALGVASGALAATTMRLMCMNANESAVHLLLGHGTAMLVGAAVGVALARWTRA